MFHPYGKYFSSFAGRKVPKNGEGRPAKSLILAAGVFFRNSGTRASRSDTPDFYSEKHLLLGAFRGDFTQAPI
jgi:hypothetical protein